MIGLNALINTLVEGITAPLDLDFQSAVIDSRQAQPGSLFIALPGEQTDGHNFVQAAFDYGAQVALVHKEMDQSFPTVDLRDGHYNPGQWPAEFPLCLRVEDTLMALQSIAANWRKQHNLRVVGITGSVGKTTTKELTAALLSQKYTVLKNPGNRNNEIGLPLTLLELEDRHDCAVLEMGFYVAGEIQTLCNIAQPQVGVITNVGTVHAERAGSQEMIAQGKSELIQALPPSPEGIAILNMDDPWVRRMRGKTQAQQITYGIYETADLTASHIKLLGIDGLSCVLTYQGKSHPIRSPLLGEFSVYTILRSVAVALAEGLSWDEITLGLSAGRVDLRMHTFMLPDGATIIDDTYNASPESTIAALQFLKTLGGRRVAILGDMLELGRYEQEGHQQVGAFSASGVDLLILVGPRTRFTAQTALDHGFPEEKLFWYRNSSEAARSAAELIKKGDVVLVKGSNSMRMDKILTALEARS
jgi:UDP-N-acetylmuramoyl-tripeptide--D-alanyl-D-alanine ligase